MEKESGCVLGKAVFNLGRVVRGFGGLLGVQLVLLYLPKAAGSDGRCPVITNRLVFV